MYASPFANITFITNAQTEYDIQIKPFTKGAIRMHKKAYPQAPLMPIGPVKTAPHDTYHDKFDIYTALQKGTLFCWLFDPYYPQRLSDK
jgi:hypothetical protein